MPRIDSKQPMEEVRKAMTGGPVAHRGEAIRAPEGCHEKTPLCLVSNGMEHFMWGTIRTQLSHTLGGVSLLTRGRTAGVGGKTQQ